MQTKPTTIYIVRHGESEGNIKKILGLTPEVRLTNKGILQVESVSNKLSTVQFDVIFSSDLIRAKQTAEILAKEKKITIIMNKMLRERTYGKLNGKTTQEMKEELKDIYDEYEKMSNKNKYYSKLVEDMETVEEAILRFITTLRTITITYNEKTILVVSHVTLMRGLLIHLGFADFHEIDSSKNCIQNTAYIKLESDNVNFFVKEIFNIRKKN